MKRILLLTILLVSSIAVFAQRGVAGLKVRLSTNEMLAVAIDDRYFEKRGTSLTIGKVPAGKHYLKVYKLRVRRNGNGKAEMVYSGYVVLKPGTFNSAMVDPFRRRMQLTTSRAFDKPEREDVYGDWDDRYSDHYDDRQDDRYRERDRYNDNGNVLRSGDVSDLSARVKDRITDTDRMKLMQSVLSGRTYYTEQVRTMMGWFSFESSKLEFAKWAYDNTLDRDQYWKLEDMFSFSSSKNELNEYIQSRPVNTTNDNYQYRDDRRSNNRYSRNALREQDMTDLAARVKDRMGDSDKMKLVQSVVQGKEYYSEQVRTMLGWFSFESTKLEFAKWAYDGVVDKDNYWKLEDVFSFSSSKTELSEYIQGRR